MTYQLNLLCGCTIDYEIGRMLDARDIRFCPLHAAAGKMLEAGKNLVKNLPESEIELVRDIWGNTNTRIISDAVFQVKTAIAAAEPKETK